MLTLIPLLLLSLFPVLLQAQTNSGITVSGQVRNSKKLAVPHVNVVFKASKDSRFVVGAVTNDQGRFSLGVKSESYILEISMVGFKTKKQPFTVGAFSNFLDLGLVELEEDVKLLNEIKVGGVQQDSLLIWVQKICLAI